VLGGGPDPTRGLTGRGAPLSSIANLCHELCNKRSAVAEMGDRLTTIDMGRKVEGVVSLSVGGTGCPSTTISPERSPTSVPSGILIHTVVWPQQTWVENWGLRPFSGGELGPYLTQCGPGRSLPPYQVSS